MKRVLIIAFIFAAFCVPAFADSLFDEGNAHYEKGDFKKAIEVYQKIMPKTAAVHYNLGNAYFKAGQRAKALAEYERTLRQAPRDADARWNLDVVRSTFKDEAPTHAGFFLSKLREAAESFSWNGLLAAFAASWALLALIAILSFMFPDIKKSTPVLSFAISACIAVTALFIFMRYPDAHQRRIVIVDKEAGVFYGPSERETKAFTLHEGAEATVHDESKDWLYLKRGDKSGWIKKSSCEEI
jgi:tetratricopeptide (TPR) repeat protein